MEVFVDIVIHILVPLMVLTFLTLVAILVVNRMIYEVYKFRIKSVKSKIDGFLTALVFSPFEEDTFAKKIKNFKKKVPFEKNWCKEIILNEIINLKQNLKGESASHLHFIYEEFGLFQFSLRLLKKPQWYVKSMGIYHFKALEYTKGEKFVAPYLKSKKGTLSTNAHIALIALTSDKLNFLIDYPETLSLTSEIKIMDILHSRKPPMPTNLKDWIHSPNPSIVKLGVKFMVYYNFTITREDVIRLLNSNAEMIRTEVIVAARNIYIEDAEQILISQFHLEEKKNKIEILTSLGAIGTEVSEGFLSRLLVDTADIDIKLAAVYSLNAINEGYFEKAFTDNEEVMDMVEHVKDPYI